MQKATSPIGTQQQQEEEKEDNVVSLQVITGGKDGGFSGTGNWLQRMVIGTCFYAKKRGEWQCVMFRVGGKTEKTYVLQSLEHPTPIPVDPIAFCNTWVLHEDLGILATPEELQGEEDEQRDRIPERTDPEADHVERPDRES